MKSALTTLLLLLLITPTAAQAQPAAQAQREESDPPPSDPPDSAGADSPARPALDVLSSAAERDELSSINSEAGWATGLYVGGGISLGLGAVGAAGLGLPFELGAVAFLVAVPFAGLGLIALGIAIGLDVDSGSRRDALDRRRAAGTAHLEVGPGGAALSVAF